MKLFLYFMIYSMLGWLIESLYVSIANKRLINSGFLFGPYCPIYGLGSLIVLFLLSSFHHNILLLFILSFLLTSILEYFTSYILEKLFGVLWWDYSKMKFNIKGRVCLLNSILFGIMSLIVTYLVHPIIYNFIESNSNTVLTIMFIFLLSVLIIDLFYSVKRLIRFKQSLSSFNKDMIELQNYFNQFPNMSIKNKRN